MGSDQHIKDVNMMEISVLIKVIKGERNLAEIARSLDITLQGVRYYINILRQDGYLLDLDITSKGYEFLSSSLFQIKKFLNDNSDFLSDANGWEVICDDDIKSGDIVYLRMAHAYLHVFNFLHVLFIIIAVKILYKQHLYLSEINFYYSLYFSDDCTLAPTAI